MTKVTPILNDEFGNVDDVDDLDDFIVIIIISIQF